MSKIGPSFRCSRPLIVVIGLVLFIVIAIVRKDRAPDDNHQLGDMPKFEAFPPFSHSDMAYHRRVLRNVEGAPCKYLSTVNDTLQDSCQVAGLVNTVCNNVTGQCQCDARFTAAICIPTTYVRATEGRCLPTFPDICNLNISGSFCGSVAIPGNSREMRCVCQAGGGTWPNCQPRLGSPCKDIDGCRRHLRNSFCANITAGYGTCQCPANGTVINMPNRNGSSAQESFINRVTTIANQQQTECVPLTCPAAQPEAGSYAIQACHGDTDLVGALLPFVCIDKSPRLGASVTVGSGLSGRSGYTCKCRKGARGQSHNATTLGRCCSAPYLACSDFSRCVDAKKFCDGSPDCPDGSDERPPFCTSANAFEDE